MTSQIESFNTTQYTPLYDNEQPEGENKSMEPTYYLYGESQLYCILLAHFTVQSYKVQT